MEGLRASAGLLAGAAAAALLALSSIPSPAQPSRDGPVTDTPIPWSPPNSERPRLRVRHVPGDGMAHHRAPSAAPGGSTHEIAFDERRGGDLWISGQTWDSLVRVTPRGTAMRFVPMPAGSGPHGLAFDAAGRLWVTLEYSGRVRALDAATGRVLADHDVRLHCTSCPERINSHPHGLAIGADGETVWFTGKATGTIGRISPGGEVATFALATVGSVPIYIRAGPDGNMWATELVGNAIARVTPEGEIEEFPIPTPNSRPIAIVPGPDGAMWFSEEAGGNVGRIDRQGRITEYPVPRASPNAILAGLAFDRDGNLWVQQYADPAHPLPGEPPADHIVRIDRRSVAAGPARLTEASFTFYPVPTRQTVMHRIVQGPDGAMWFTEMRADRVGRLAR